MTHRPRSPSTAVRLRSRVAGVLPAPAPAPALAACLAIACSPAGGPAGTSAGAVAAASAEATAAGAEILEAGGNAIDAAVAVSFALGVTEPAMSGLGGQTQILFHPPTGEPVVINGTSYSPSGTPTDATPDDLIEHRATTIPTTVRTLGYAWRTHGSGNLQWADLLAPAIRYAEEGFTVGPFRHEVWQRHESDLAADSVLRELFLVDGAAPDEGSVFRQPVLAATLRRLAEHGADDFYTGEIGTAIAADMAANGGWITTADLRNVPEPGELTPLSTTYRNWTVYTLPPPGGGWVVLQVLNLFELSTPEQLAPTDPRRLPRIAEALRIGHRSRRDSPVTDLIDYADEASSRTSKETARDLLHRSSSGETTHFSIADGDGMVVAVTASINAFFGARAASPRLGFLYNSYMHEFETDDPGHPFALRGNAMPYSSMSPTILARDGRPALALGSPGSARIISAVAQVVELWVDQRMGIEEAVAAPRVHVVPDSALYLESGDLPPAVREVLEASGFFLVRPNTDLAIGERNAYFGGVHAVALEGGQWRGAADPRRDGTSY